MHVLEGDALDGFDLGPGVAVLQRLDTRLAVQHLADYHIPYTTCYVLHANTIYYTPCTMHSVLYTTYSLYVII